MEVRVMPRRPIPQFHMSEVNEAHTELVRVKELKREDQLRRISKKAFQDQQARRSASESALQRAGRKTLQEQLQHPNTWRYDKPQRQLKHQVLQGDGRAKMLSRVFLNGEWTYCA
mmetsp:Transcript_26734/g.63646  ORF Transcript_26734/g.63646 Transcript_26734/m.63646 type:complete len:115 (+) Transcript_26734:67-411(+)